MLIGYAAALLSAAWIGEPLSAPTVLATVALALFAGLCVFAAARWPEFALAAGLTIVVAMVALWIAGPGVPFVEVGSWLDWSAVLAHAAGSAYVPIVGVVLASAAIVSLRRTPRN